MGKVHEVFQTLDKYDHVLADTWASLRKSAVSGGTAATRKCNELIMVGSYWERREWKESCQKAVRARETPRDVHQALAIRTHLMNS